MTSSCRTMNAVAGVSEKSSRVAWGKGRKLGSILSDNAGIAAAVLSPGGVFIDKKKKKPVDINRFHVFLAHAHSSVLKPIALQHGIQLVG